ncbi:MAG: hypothetical protein AAGA56_21175 [Myxococcota bacterium]
MLIEEVAAAFEENGVRYGVAGGFAVALHGAVRGTVDLDIVLALDRTNYERAEAVLLSLGFIGRLPVRAGDVFDNRKDYINNRNLIAWSFVDPSDPSRLVDILIIWEEDSVPTVDKGIGSTTVRVLAKEQLIEMKRASGRPQDVEDVRALEQLP